MPKEFMWKGEYRCMKDIAEMEGIPYFRITSRIAKGWSIEDAVNTPAHETPISEKKRTRIPWREVSEIEIYFIKARKCSRCKYANGSTVGNNGFSQLTCDYIGKVGHRRSCDPRDCEYWKEPGERVRRRYD